MNDNTRDFLMWKNSKGRYSEGGRHHGTKAPQEGGILSPEYRASTGDKSVRAMYRNYSGAVVSSVEPLEPEYTPIQMVADPFDKSAKAKKAGALETEMPEPMMQDAEAPENVFTPISCYVEGEAAGSVQ